MEADFSSEEQNKLPELKLGSKSPKSTLVFIDFSCLNLMPLFLPFFLDARQAQGFISFFKTLLLVSNLSSYLDFIY